MTKKPKIKLVILDCDGVILDSNGTYADMYVGLFKKYKIKASRKEIYKHFGQKPEKLLHAIFHKRNIKNIFNDYKKELDSPSMNKKIKEHKGARKSIIKLSKNYKVAVVSGAMRIRLVKSFDRFRIRKYLSYFLGSDDVKFGKPNPEAIIKTMKKMKMGRDQTVFVGDAPSDLRAAKRAKVTFIAVLSGILDKKTARKMKADYIVNDINDVQKLIEKII